MTTINADMTADQPWCVGANGETSEAHHGAIRIVDGTVMDALYAATRDMGS